MNDIYRRVHARLSAPAWGPWLLAGAALLVICHAVYTRWRMMAIGKELLIFGSFWESGNAANLGRDPYAVYPLVISTGGDNPIAELNMNPPSLLWLFQWLARFDPATGRLAWLIVTATLFIAVAVLIFRTARPNNLQAPWLLLFPAVAGDLALGQIYSLLFALGTGAWFFLRSGRNVAAAVCMGVLIAIKPNFGIWCLLALAAGHATPALLAGAIGLCLTAMPALFYGLDVYHQWLAAVGADRHFLFPSSITIYAFFARLGAPAAAYGPMLAVLAWSVILCRRIRPTLYDLTPIAVLVSILCAPLAWFHYFLVISAFVVDRPWNKAMWVAIVLTLLERFWGHSFELDVPARIAVGLLAIAPAVIMLVEFVARARANSARGSFG